MIAKDRPLRDLTVQIDLFSLAKLPTVTKPQSTTQDFKDSV